MVFSLRAFVLSALSLGALRAFGFDITRKDNVRRGLTFALFYLPSNTEY